LLLNIQNNLAMPKSLNIKYNNKIVSKESNNCSFTGQFLSDIPSQKIHPQLFGIKVNKTTFKGLGANTKIARETVQEFHKELGFLHSDSFIQLKIYKHRQDKKFEPINQKLGVIAKKYANEVGDVMYKQQMELFSTDMPEHQITEQLKLYVKEAHAGNCDQQAEILQEELKKKGISARNLNFRILNKADDQMRECGGHSFDVIGMDKNADIQNPDSWGVNAVIADSWANISEPAPTGLKYLKEIFDFNPETEYLIFDDKDLLRQNLIKAFSDLRKTLNDVNS